MVNLLNEYLNRAKEIIGERTKEEERYDNEVLKWLRKDKNIKKAINKANQKYPDEALELDSSNINDVKEHYNYLLEHVKIMHNLEKNITQPRRPT